MKSLNCLLLISFITLLFACSKDDDNTPVACFEYTANEGTVTFDASCSQNVSDYIWFIGNDMYDQEVVTHQFQSSGSYEISLMVYSDDNESDIFIDTIIVQIQDTTVNEDCVECSCSVSTSPFPNANTPYNSCTYQQDPSLFEAMFKSGCQMEGGTATCAEVD